MWNRITETLSTTSRALGLLAAPALGKIVYATAAAAQKAHAMRRVCALARIALVAAGTIPILSALSMPVSGRAVNSSGAPPCVQRARLGPLHKPLRSVWIPVLASTLSGFTFVKSRQRKCK